MVDLVSDRIHDAQRNVSTCLEYVQQVHGRLHHRAEEVRAQLGGIEAERNDLLTRDSL